MIDFTAEQMAKAERLLRHIPDAAPTALARAINRAAESARTAAARKVRETYFIRHKDVTDTIKIRGASPTKLSASVVSSGSVFPLTAFRVSPKRPQPQKAANVRWQKGKAFKVVARVKRGEGGPIKSAFVAQMRSGHVGVFKRAGKERKPIDQFYGPSVPQMLGNPSVTDWVNEKAKETLDQRLDHEINRLLEANR
ncbi:phage tail protein [Brevibacillus agri]|uniref:phage tail protein n=1 Tax=Brevibacillus agri TaxID=51101 RepID=UPI002E1EA5E7|nr:phage tail protein [Brevibacillus agri]